MTHQFKIGDIVITLSGLRGTIYSFCFSPKSALKAILRVGVGKNSVFIKVPLNELINVSPLEKPDVSIDRLTDGRITEEPLSAGRVKGKPDSLESYSVESVPDLCQEGIPDPSIFSPDPPFTVSDKADDGPEVEILKSIGYGMGYPDAKIVLRAIVCRREKESHDRS